MNINWSLKHFKDLSPAELYAILRLRNEVFVVEQNCVFQDADNKDHQAFHFMGWDNDTLVAYTRLIPPGVSYTESSIGRVVTAANVRKTGIGKILMTKSITELYGVFGNGPIKIGAQLYLKNFYELFHFSKSSEIYLEDGIEHIEMILP